MLGGFDLPRGAVVGVIADEGAGVVELLRLVPSEVKCFAYTLDRADALGRLRAESSLEALRRSGSTAILASHDEQLLRRLSDEIWWIDQQEVVARGEANEILPQYAAHVMRKLREESSGQVIAPTLRRGDGRAELIAIETLDESGKASTVWQSQRAASVRVTVRYRDVVEDPVVGIMIRTRIGMEVYGTNTELEAVRVGPCAAGDIRVVEFGFECNLCPQYYTITAASHDKDGVLHDWVEDAVAVVVHDSRYTAGVANLNARVTCLKG